MIDAAIVEYSANIRGEDVGIKVSYTPPFELHLWEKYKGEFTWYLKAVAPSAGIEYLPLFCKALSIDENEEVAKKMRVYVSRLLKMFEKEG